MRGCMPSPATPVCGSAFDVSGAAGPEGEGEAPRKSEKHTKFGKCARSERLCRVGPRSETDAPTAYRTAYSNHTFTYVSLHTDGGYTV